MGPLRKRLYFKWIRLPAGAGMGLGGQTGATTASDASPNGEAPVGVVVVGLDLQAIEDSVEGAGGAGGIGANEGPAGGGGGNGPLGDVDEGSVGTMQWCLLIPL